MNVACVFLVPEPLTFLKKEIIHQCVKKEEERHTITKAKHYYVAVANSNSNKKTNTHDEIKTK